MLHPVVVFEIPLDGLSDTLFEHSLGFPADLFLDLVGSDSISSVMTFSVCYILDKVIAKLLFSGITVIKLFSENIDNSLNDLDILLLIVSADIVCLEESSLLLYHVDRLCMIFNKEPVTNILTVTVHGKILTCKCIVDHKRNELLRELIRSVVI